MFRVSTCFSLSDTGTGQRKHPCQLQISVLKGWTRTSLQIKWKNRWNQTPLWYNTLLSLSELFFITLFFSSLLFSVTSFRSAAKSSPGSRMDIKEKAPTVRTTVWNPSAQQRRAPCLLPDRKPAKKQAALQSWSLALPTPRKHPPVRSKSIQSQCLRRNKQSISISKLWAEKRVP